MDTLFDSMEHITLAKLNIDNIRITLQCGRCGAGCKKLLTAYIHNDHGYVDCSHCEEHGYDECEMKLAEMQIRY